MFCGAFGYADDVVLLSPTVQGLKFMLKICNEFAKEFNVIFNSQKSKLIVCDSNNVQTNISIHFMGLIECVKWDKHLGNLFGNISQDEIISQISRDFMCRVNMVKTHFTDMPIDTMYSLFKTYCMPLYGSQLWDLSSRSMNKFYVSWRKSIRYLLGLPRTTHCNLLHLICNDVPVDYQLIYRFCTFYNSLISSNNVITGYIQSV